MYDNIKLWIPIDTSRHQVEELQNYISNPSITHYENKDSVKIGGNLRNLKVTADRGNVWVHGSLAKYHFGNNVCNLDKKSTKDCLQSLADTLHLDINEARVTSVEFGSTFPMKRQVTEYLHILSSCPRRTRVSFEENTLYFQSGKDKYKKATKQMVFYDKAAELRKNNECVQVGFDGANLLRFETRYHGKLASALKWGVPIYGKDLYDSSFYQHMKNRYLSDYESIKKVECNIMEQKRTSKGAKEMLIALLLNSAENQAKFEEFVKQLETMNFFKTSREFCRFKNDIQALRESVGEPKTNDLVQELNDAVRNACAY